MSRYKDGVRATMRLFQEEIAPTIYKRFTPEVQGAIMGFCGVTAWSAVLQIWKEIEATKNEADLRRVLMKHWAK